MTYSKLIKGTAGPIAYWSGKMGGEHGIRDKGRTVTLLMLLFCEPDFKILWAQTTILQCKEQNHLSAKHFCRYDENHQKKQCPRKREVVTAPGCPLDICVGKAPVMWD